MAHLNDTMVHGILDVTEQIVLTSKKYNVAKYNSGLILGDTSIATQLVGNGISIDSESILKLLAAGAITIENTSGGITIKSAETLSVTANSSASITGKTGTTITGDGTTGVKLVGTRLCVPSASYGTEDPPTGAQIGQIYFKIIS